MQCIEFREVAESYLSDELLVETCIQVFRHLEDCQSCRVDFGAKRELRLRVRDAIKNADQLQIDPIFAGRLTADLREAAFNDQNRLRQLFTLKVLIPTMAVLLLVFIAGFVAVSKLGRSGRTLSPEFVASSFTDISLKAIGDHEDCALEKLQQWEMMSKTDYVEKATYTEKVARPLQANFSDDIEMLSAHDCFFEGQEFTHVILRKSGHIVSVFFKKDATADPIITANSTIISRTKAGLHLAGFQKDDEAVFVVSELSELDNISIARVLSNSWQASHS
ncbi:MAG: hypothetical protein ABR530_09585 [Pyrinomonadaceae bacterium]